MTLEVRGADVPLFEGVAAIAERNRSGGLASNQEHFGGWVDDGGLGRSSGRRRAVRPPNLRRTAGCGREGAADQAETAFAVAGVRSWRIGRVVAKAGDTRVRVV